MIVRMLKLLLVAAALLIHARDSAAQPAQPADDPLPKHCKVRYGVTRPILRTSPHVALLPGGYTNFLAPTLTGGIRRYDVATGRPLQKDGVVGPGQVVVSADGKRAAVARPGALSVVEVATGKELLAVQAPAGVVIAGVPGVSLSADGKLLAYGVRGLEGRGEAVVCDVDKDEVVAQVETAQSAPIYPLLARDGKTLVTHGPPAPAPTLDKAKEPKAKPVDADMERTAQVWEVATSKELFKARVTGMGGMVVASALSNDGGTLAISAGDGPVDLFDVKTGKRTQTLLGRKAQGVRVAISPDGKTIASIGPDYRIQRWTSDGRPLGISEPPPGGLLVGQLTALAFRDNQKVIAWLTVQQFCHAWEAPATKLLSPQMDHMAAIRSIAFAKDQKSTLSSGYDGRVFRWDFNTGALGEEITLRPAHLPGAPLIRPIVNLSRDAVRATWMHTPIEIFDMENAEDLFVVPPPSTALAPISTTLSPDGLKLITVSRRPPHGRTGACVIWDLLTQQRVAEFDVPGTANPTAPVAALSPDGSRLALMSVSRALMVTGFEVKTGKKLADVEDFVAAAGTMSIVVADDTFAVIASTSGRIWAVDFVKGQIEPDIDKMVAQPDPPICGPIVFSPDGKYFATGVVGEQYTTYGVRLYDWRQRKPIHTFIGHAGPISAIRFSEDGHFLASGAQDTSVLLWDLRKLDLPR